jgi:WD40 repeat protein
MGSFTNEGRLGWLPDLLSGGRTAVLFGPGTELSLLDIRSGNETGQLKLPGHIFMRWHAVGEAGAVSRDGRWVFSLDNDSEEGNVGSLSIRDMTSGKVLATYRDAAPGRPKTALSDRVYVLRFLPDGATAIWSTRDGFVRRWRWAEPSSQPIAEPGHRGIVWDIDSSPDGRRFATAGDDQTVRVWDAENLGEMRVLRGHDAAVFTVAYSPDGQWLASGGQDGTIKLWDLNRAGGSGEVPVLVARQLANRLAFAPDGRALAVGTDDDGVAVVDAESGQVTTSFNNLLFPAGFTSDGTRIVGLGGVGDLVTGKVGRSIESPDNGYPWTQAVSPDGRWLIRSFKSRSKKNVPTELLDMDRGLIITNFIPHSTVLAARFTRDGQTILAYEANGMLDWWSVSSKGLEPQRAVQIGHFSRALALSPDGATVAVGGFSRISLVDYRTGSIRQRLFGHGQEITGLAFSPDCGTLASCSMDGTIKLWNLRTMQEVCTINFDVKPALGKELGVQDVGFAPDGNSLWAFSRSGILKYWRAAMPEEIAAAQKADRP